MFVAGENDWGVYQSPGALATMQTKGCARFEGTHLLPNTGHWAMQEQPAAVSQALAAFLLAERAL
jgi:pimeloyl-ACP methyl ester carboxylesterase